MDTSVGVSVYHRIYVSLSLRVSVSVCRFILNQRMCSVYSARVRCQCICMPVYLCIESKYVTVIVRKRIHVTVYQSVSLFYVCVTLHSVIDPF